MRHAPRPSPRRPAWIGLVAIAVVLAAAPPACVTDPRPDLPQDAIVTYETVRFAPPNEDDPYVTETSSSDMATATQPLVGDPSGARAVALATIRSTNGLLWGTLFSIDLISRFPPREASETQWAWQGADLNGLSESRFVLDDLADGNGPRFGYTLGKRLVLSDDPFETTFDGEYSPTPDDPSATERIRTGTGVLRYHLDSAKTYNPDSATGNLAVAFRSEAGVRSVRAFMREVQGANDPRPLTAVYEYSQNVDGSGDYAFSVRADWFADGEPLEDVAVRVVWTPDGGGRVLGVVSGGSVADYGVTEMTVQECWRASDGITTWVDTTPDSAALEGGAETDCEAALQGITVDPPVAEVPPATGDPAIPE